jgi:hypothetical protein
MIGAGINSPEIAREIEKSSLACAIAAREDM